MKALSVRQPWANLIASGCKEIETRTWSTKHRGELLICSSRRPVIHPAGRALAVVRLVDCRLMVPDDERRSCCEYSPGLWAWELELVAQLGHVFPVRGQLRLFEVEFDLPAYESGS